MIYFASIFTNRIQIKFRLSDFDLWYRWKSAISNCMLLNACLISRTVRRGGYSWEERKEENKICRPIATSRPVSVSPVVRYRRSRDTYTRLSRDQRLTINAHINTRMTKDHNRTRPLRRSTVVIALRSIWNVSSRRVSRCLSHRAVVFGLLVSTQCYSGIHKNERKAGCRETCSQRKN